MCWSCADPPSVLGLTVVLLCLVVLIVFGHLDD